MEGKTFMYNDGKTKHEAIVIGCDIDIGLTVMNKDKTKYLICFNGPLVKNINYFMGRYNIRYRLYFYIVLKWIKEGKVLIKKLDKLTQTIFFTMPSNNISAKTCPFN